MYRYIGAQDNAPAAPRLHDDEGLVARQDTGHETTSRLASHSKLLRLFGWRRPSILLVGRARPCERCTAVGAAARRTQAAMGRSHVRALLHSPPSPRSHPASRSRPPLRNTLSQLERALAGPAKVISLGRDYTFCAHQNIALLIISIWRFLSLARLHLGWPPAGRLIGGGGGQMADKLA
jgi:hypothetical protein